MRHLVLTRNTQGKYKKKYKTLTKHKVNIAKINNTFYSVSLLIDTTPVRMAAIQKSTSNKCWRVWRKGNPFTLLVGVQTSTATIENSVETS